MKNHKHFSVILLSILLFVPTTLLGQHTITLKGSYLDEELFYSADDLLPDDCWRDDAIVTLTIPKDESCLEVKFVLDNKPSWNKVQAETSFKASLTKIKDATDCLFLTNEAGFELVLSYRMDNRHFCISLGHKGEFSIDYIANPYTYLSIPEAFARIKKELLAPFITCSRTWTDFLKLPMGIKCPEGWNTPYEQFIPIAERFYGEAKDFLGLHYKFENFHGELCGQKIDVIDIEKGTTRNMGSEKHILDIECNVFLLTPQYYKARKKYQHLQESECQWDKKSAMRYRDEILAILRREGIYMQKINNWRYEGYNSDGRKISLSCYRLSRPCFYSVSLTVHNKTEKDSPFSIILDYKQ